MELSIKNRLFLKESTAEIVEISPHFTVEKHGILHEQTVRRVIYGTKK